MIMAMNLRTKRNNRVFSMVEQIHGHDYIAIRLDNHDHLVLKDRYKSPDVPNGFNESSCPYVIPASLLNQHDLASLIKSNKYDIFTFIESKTK